MEADGRGRRALDSARLVLCVNNAEVLRDVALKGRGVALIPEFVAGEALKKGRLKVILKDFWAPPLALYAVYPPTRHLSVKVRLFIDFLVERFGAQSTRKGIEIE